jgi:hypothetical protein
MRVPWKIAVPISCIALISGAAVAWQVLRVRANGLKLAQDATVCRVRAEQGDAKAEANLGNMYSHGQGVPQDYAEAVRWYRKAADQGDANGQDGLASMYYYGDGVPTDYAEALRWYSQAADQGNAKAENGIALMYSQGLGVSQDYAEALRWYRKATDQGYAKAEYNLGNMYYYGRGVPQNRTEAERWYHKAADQGDEYAQRALGLRGSGLSSVGMITLSGLFVACLWALKDPISPQRSLRYRQQPALTMAGICGLAYIGLSLYGAFGIFQSALRVNAFNFVKNLVAGIAMATLICMLRPKSVKVVLGISGVLLIGIDLIVIWSHELTRFVTTIRGFSSVNGLLIGMAVPLAIFLWRENIKRARDKQAAG